MTIFASHFALVLGAWRLRIRIDLDEPRESELEERTPRYREEAPSSYREMPAFVPRGRG